MGCEPFFERLVGLRGRERARAKWVIVPNRAIALTLADRLARDKGDWANVRLVTPLDLATRMAAPFLLERHIDPSGDGVGPALVMRLLVGFPEAGGYFRPMAEHTSMAGALWRAIRELRYAGVRAASLQAAPFTVIPEKQAEFVALLAAYERHLETERVADMPAVFEEAVRHPGWSPIVATDLVIELPDARWPPLVRTFLDALPGERVPSQAAAPFVGAPAAPASPAISIFHAGGRDGEIDEVFRRTASSGLPLDQVEIACASGVASSLVWEKATRLGWPVTLSAGLPATASRAGRLLLRFCDWIASEFDAASLRRLFQSGDLAADAIAADLSPGQAARLLLKAQATWGRGTYVPALTRRAEEYGRRADDPEAPDDDREWSGRKAAQTRALRGWVEAALARIPAPGAPAPLVDLAALVDAAAWFIEAHAASASALDAMGRSALIDALGELRALGQYRCGMSTGLRFLRERVESLSVGRDRPRPGSLHVSSLREAGFDARPLVFIVGLEEGAVFSSAVEDPVLLDRERAAIAPPLSSSLERQADDIDTVLARIAALASSCRQVSFSFSCRDTREFRETFPSWVVLEAFRLQQRNRRLTYDDLAKHLGEPVSSVPPDPAAALTEAAWWVAQRDLPSAVEEVLRTFPALERGREAERQRASDEFTEFDGLVPEAGAALDPSRTGRPVSATALETAAKCPLRFFMRSGLGVRPIEEGRPDEDGWLAPTTRGSELHKLFARIMRHARSGKRKPHAEKDRDLLRAWGRECLAQLKAGMPPSSEEVFARESREFLEDLDTFIAAECEGRHGSQPLGFEVPFGFPIEPGNEEPLAREEPLVVDIGHGRRLVLHGFIDRINRVAPGEFEVADYKSSYWAKSWQGTFAGGRRLQHAVYAFAAAQALRALDPCACVVRGVYLFPTAKGYRLKKEFRTPTKAEFTALLRRIADVVGSGVFAPADGEDDCTWCEFGAACRVTSAAGAAMCQDEDNTLLEPYRELRRQS